MNGTAGGGPLVVLDDDPTGTQAVTGVPVLFEWDSERLRGAAEAGAKAVFLLTNTRAFSPDRAREIVRSATEAAVAAFGRPRLLLRGDSTLRGHLFEEYEAVCSAAHGGGTPPLLLVPALPSAGRITNGGIHYLVRGGDRVPLHETEYAADPAFGYRDARLLRWAEERSGGRFAAEAGREVPLAQVRSARGAEAVSSALLELIASPAPGVCAPDAETVGDLTVICAGLRMAEAAGADVIVRSAPTFAGVLGDVLATERVAPPPATAGMLVICGSWVPLSTRQLAALAATHPDSLIEVDVVSLASDQPQAEIERAAYLARERLRVGGLAVVATSRERPVGVQALEAGERIAANLATVLQRLDLEAVVVLAKGGVTSAVTARVGLRAWRADVCGPLLDGVALWNVHGEHLDVPYLVFPGNIGDERTLLNVVDLVLAA